MQYDMALHSPVLKRFILRVCYYFIFDCCHMLRLFQLHKNISTCNFVVKCYVWSMALYGAETWKLWATDQKCLESFEMWCWRRMEKISWTDHVRSEEVLLRVNKQRNILHEIRKWKANWIGHILRRNCLLQQVIEGKIKGQIEVTRRRGRRRKKLLGDLKDRRGYCQLKEEILDRTMWRNRFGRGFGLSFHRLLMMMVI